jgi:hypothetical protein
MKERLKKAYELASRSAGTAQERPKSGYDKTVIRMDESSNMRLPVLLLIGV